MGKGKNALERVQVSIQCLQTSFHALLERQLAPKLTLNKMNEESEAVGKEVEGNKLRKLRVVGVPWPDKLQVLWSAVELQVMVVQRKSLNLK